MLPCYQNQLAEQNLADTQGPWRGVALEKQRGQPWGWQLGCPASQGIS